MRIIAVILLVISLSAILSSCYTLAVGGAGAGGGYILRDKEEEKKGR